MIELLLRLLGVDVSETMQVTTTSLAFRGGVSFGWILLSAVILAVAVFWLYRRYAAHVSAFPRYALATLRVLFLLLVLMLLMRPILSLTVDATVRRGLVLLFDTSASMGIKDPRYEQHDLKRAAIARGALDPAKGLEQDWDGAQARDHNNVSRSDLLKSVLKNERLQLLPRLNREYDLHPYAFGNAVTELVPTKPEEEQPTEPGKKPEKPQPIDFFTWVDQLNAESPVTAVGDAIREVIARKRGQPVAGIFLVTDGANNSGSLPLDAASLAHQERVPLYIYGIGMTRPKDIIVGNVFAQEVAFVKDEVPVTVRVRSQGMIGQTARLALKLNNETVDEKELTFADDSEQVVALKFTPPKIGEFELRAAIEPLADETVRDNNSQTHRLRVVDAKIKVLYVEQSPRWEFKHLQQVLLRDRRVEAKFVLIEGDPSIAKSEDSPYLPRFPDDKEEFFKYDLVIIGDVDPKIFSPSQFEMLGDYVSKFGGALTMIAGKRFAPQAYRKTIIESMLPVEFEASSLEAVSETVFDKPIRVELTAAGRLNPMLRLSDKELESAERWAKLPPLFWVQKVSRAKPAAEVLMVDPDPVKSSRFGKMPVMATQQYGMGQVLYVGTDNFWRWRKNTGDTIYFTLWGQVAQRMALPHLLGSSRRTHLSADRQKYMTGERVSVYARLYNQNFEPVNDPTVRGLYSQRTGPEGSGVSNIGEREVSLRPVPDSPGMYRGEFIAPEAGIYQFHVERDPAVHLDFTVEEPRFEMGETAMNEPMLKQMAEDTGGAFFREESLDKLPETIRRKSERVRSTMDVELWCSPLYFLLMLSIVTIEWVLRKRFHLK